ncbi:MAG: hypothetical protein ACFCBU_01095 [Cyanophyceae cyanobacterium]
MHLRPSILIAALALSAGAAIAEAAPAQAGITQFQETHQDAAPVNSTEARRRYRRRTRTSHRGSGRRQMIRHILATEA